MAFFKASVERFLDDHRSTLPSDVVQHAEEAIKGFADGDMLFTDAANSIFGDHTTAQWFLAEVMANPAHVQVAFDNKPDGSGQ